MAKTKKVKIGDLKQGQCFRRGRKKAVWIKKNSCCDIVQITGKDAGLYKWASDLESVTPVNVQISEVKD